MSTFTIKSLGNTLDTLAWFISITNAIHTYLRMAIFTIEIPFFKHKYNQYNSIKVRKTLVFTINQTFRMRKWALSSALCSDIKVYIYNGNCTENWGIFNPCDEICHSAQLHEFLFKRPSCQEFRVKTRRTAWRRVLQNYKKHSDLILYFKGRKSKMKMIKDLINNLILRS